MLTLQIKERKDEKLDTLRAEGVMPAVFYGPKEENQSISLDRLAFEKVWHEAGESAIIGLEGVGEAKDVLINDVDVNPLNDRPRHADFYVIEKGKKLNVKIPLEFVGEAPAVKSLGGILVKVLHELEIEALPKDLPHEITVDISSLVDFNSSIHVKDLPLPEGVTALAEAEETVAVAEAPREIEEDTPAEIDMDAIETEKKGKDEEATEGEEGKGDAGGDK